MKHWQHSKKTAESYLSTLQMPGLVVDKEDLQEVGPYELVASYRPPS